MSNRNRVAGGVAGGIAATIIAAAAFIAPWEGLRTDAYRDIVGVWTVCYGETRGVQPGDSYAPAECQSMLEEGVREFYVALNRCIPNLHTMPQSAQVAFTSWSYNVGIGAACRSTLARLANAGDIEGACNQLPRWNRAGGQVVRGLTNRRVSERQLCLSELN